MYDPCIINEFLIKLYAITSVTHASTLRLHGMHGYAERSYFFSLSHYFPRKMCVRLLCPTRKWLPGRWRISRIVANPSNGPDRGSGRVHTGRRTDYASTKRICRLSVVRSDERRRKWSSWWQREGYRSNLRNRDGTGESLGCWRLGNGIAESLRNLPVTVLKSQKEIVGRASLGKLISLVRQRRCAIGCVETW